MTLIPASLIRWGATSRATGAADAANDHPDLSTRATAIGLTLAAGLAVVLRLRMLLVGRSLWLDETMIALNICGRTWGGLFQPLDLDQGAPVGFLLLEKLAVTGFGTGEVALRLVPFFASLATLVLLGRFCAVYLGRREAVIAVALAGVCPALIYYAGEVKQYGVDVAVGLMLLNLVADALRVGLTSRRALGLALAGAASVWLSHTSIFFLAAAGLTIFGVAIRNRDRGEIGRSVLMGGFWLASFATVYVLTMRSLGDNRFLEEYWAAGFLPLIPTSPRDVRRYLGVGFGLFRALFFNMQMDLDLSPKMEVGMAVAWLAGLVCLGTSRGRRGLLPLLAGPIALALLAAMLHKYPLRDRLALFTAAATLPTIAAGFAGLIRSRDATGRVAGYGLLGCCLFLPAFQAAQFLLERPRLHDARTVLTQMAKDWRPGDVVVMDRRSAPPFDFYRTFGGVSGLDAIRPEAHLDDDLTDPTLLQREIHAHAGQARVWLLLEADLADPLDSQRQALRTLLDDRGHALATYASRRYSANLYRFD